MRSRRLSSLAGIAALAAMAFAQTAFALASCDFYRAHSYARMIAAQAAEPGACHEPAEKGNLCLAHCQGGDQTLDKHQVKVPELFVQPVLVIRGLQARAGPVLVPARLPAPAAGPPPRILFQSLLI
jgi:hypothetical protein